MAQIRKGTEYTPGPPGNQVTYNNLNDHVDNARLVEGAITEQAAMPTDEPTEGADYLLIWNASGNDGTGKLSKVLLSALLYEKQVLSGNLGLDSVKEENLAENSVGTKQIANLNVTWAKLAAALLAVPGDVIKTELVDNDLLLIGDSEDENNNKVSKVSNLASALAANLRAAGVGAFAKACVYTDATLSAGKINIATVTRLDEGRFDVAFTTAASTTQYNVQLTPRESSRPLIVGYTSKTALGFTMTVRGSNGDYTDQFTEISVLVYI